ncbi:hypothetical protein [Flocculibacter collagenilyticus]|uniref:hypothetical protein n=1 Tax=Flocculibacter collagenilyticus TaxID=2744479 RepID=UPI0018F6104B|nr:hypothetical protein [Flocculibacter collagenilyticus]
MSLKFYACCWLAIILIFSSKSQATENALKPQVKQQPSTLIFSHIPFADAVKNYAPIIREAYQDIGVKVQLVEIPGIRSVNTKKAKEYDGALMLLNTSEDLNLSFIRVPVVLSEVNMFLICASHVWCSENILHDETNVIGVVKASTAYRFSENYPITKYLINDYAVLKKMLLRKRFNYFITYQDRFALYQAPTKYRAINLSSSPMYLYHYIHQKHHKLLPKITAALANRVGKLKQYSVVR